MCGVQYALNAKSFQETSKIQRRKYFGRMKNYRCFLFSYLLLNSDQFMDNYGQSQYLPTHEDHSNLNTLHLVKVSILVLRRA